MGILTLCQYLIGQRQAILDIAASRQAIWIGLLFVLSAGFAREYDGEDLLHEPWHLLLPLAASLAASFLLFTFSWGVAKLKRAPGPGFFAAYRAFLGLFWLTAPLAWLYAIPYERFLPLYDATAANLWTLGLVSLWRVALMMRVLAVLMNYRGWSVFIVMVIADALAWYAMMFMPVPIMNIMGGVRATPSPTEAMLASVALSVRMLGGCSMPIWLAGAVVGWVVAKPAWAAAAADRAASRPLWGLACASVLVWALVLPFTQPTQMLRREVDVAFQEGRIDTALQLMSQHDRDDFSRHWDPLPARRRQLHWRKPPAGNPKAQLLEVLAVIVEQPPAPWVTELYLQELETMMRGYLVDQQVIVIADLLERLPDGAALLLQRLRQQAESEERSQLRYNLEQLDKARLQSNATE